MVFYKLKSENSTERKTLHSILPTIRKNIHYLFLYKVCKSGDQNNINRIHTLTL